MRDPPACPRPTSPSQDRDRQRANAALSVSVLHNCHGELSVGGEEGVAVS